MALAFAFVLPHIPGIAVHGGVMSALLLAVIFAIVLWIVDLVAIALSAVLTITSFGLALLWLIPLWVLGFWILPAMALKVVSDVAPHSLAVMGWTPAVLGGLVMLLIGLITAHIPVRGE